MRTEALRRDLFGQRIREQWSEHLGRRLDVLYAGCAHDSKLALDRVEARVVGVDEDLAPVRSVVERREDLDAWSLGDLRSAPIPPRSFDVVVVSFLLERIHHTELVLDRMVNSLRPGGLLLLRMRDRRSAYGLCDRLTPGWLRRLLWRHLVPAGTPGPLPAVYERVTSRAGMHAFCLARGLMVTDDVTATSGPAMRGLGTIAVTLADKLTRGRYTAAYDEVAMVIRKPQNHFARLI
ncbi:methyltransferase domain-containing protein [Thermoactinospora rubra]|uniref:methyltransferase domain-containing protein n=1 Tax=Thermoactinospora rubra TaxID=1088767 RepID=UPI001F0B4086|nr:class I SAM-dependent methyltransferase [Thermoactinospora rubra]